MARFFFLSAWRRCTPLLLCVFLANGCVSVPTERSIVGGQFAADQLDPATIRLVSWNIEKTSARGWNGFVGDGGAVRRFAGVDLLLLQEACEPSLNDRGSVARPLTQVRLGWAFAVSFESRWLACDRRQATGVLTASSVRPSSVVPLLSQHREFGLTPKAALITTYRIAGQAQTLLVINAHLLNFEWLTLDDYADQVAAIASEIDAHTGPVVLAGDFNTRNAARQAIIEELAASQRLTPVFSTVAGGRTLAVIGGDLPLDHIYYRGLRLLGPGIVGHEVAAEQSDHNSLSVEFAISDDAAPTD